MLAHLKIGGGEGEHRKYFLKPIAEGKQLGGSWQNPWNPEFVTPMGKPMVWQRPWGYPWQNPWYPECVTPMGKPMVWQRPWGYPWQNPWG